MKNYKRMMSTSSLKRKGLPGFCPAKMGIPVPATPSSPSASMDPPVTPEKDYMLLSFYPFKKLEIQLKIPPPIDPPDPSIGPPDSEIITK